MDFSNIKKIFYIVAIISMLLSIKSKVFASYSTNINNTDITFSDSFLDNSPYFAIFTYNNGGKGIVIRSDQPITFGQLSPTTYPYRYNFSGIGDNSLRHMVRYWNSSSSSNFSSVVAYVSGLDFVPLNDPSVNSAQDIVFNITQTSGNTLIPIFSNYDLYDINNTSNVIFQGTDTNPFNAPFFENVTDIENGNPDGVIIDPGELSKTDNLYFHLLEIQTGISSADDSIYYYLDKTFLLNKDSDYFSTMLADPDVFYYFIPRYKLGLSQNSSYLYVLTNSKSQIQNSHGLLEKDTANGVYDVITSDTTGVITATEEESDRMKNIEQSITQNQNTINNIENTLTNSNVTEDTETDIDTSLDFDNQNEGLNNLNNGFFSRLTIMLSNLLGYDLSQDTSISIPLPNSNKYLELHSKIIYDNVTGALRLIINAFWVYVFSFYMWKFINKIYIAVSTGHILDTFSSSGEAITNDML